MKRLAIAALGLVFAAVAAEPTLAAARQVRLSVPGMTCPSCPVTLRMVLNRLHGVHVVNADLTRLIVTVKVTDAHVTDRQLTDATKNAGYPSTIVKNDSR